MKSFFYIKSTCALNRIVAEQSELRYQSVAKGENNDKRTGKTEFDRIRYY